MHIASFLGPRDWAERLHKEPQRREHRVCCVGGDSTVSALVLGGDGALDAVLQHAAACQLSPNSRNYSNNSKRADLGRIPVEMERMASAVSSAASATWPTSGP